MSDLSPSQRLALIRLVNALPSPEFEALVFALQITPGVMPVNAAQGDRSSALLRWVEGPTGCQMEGFLGLLNEITPLPDALKSQASTQPAQPTNFLAQNAEPIARNAEADFYRQQNAELMELLKRQLDKPNNVTEIRTDTLAGAINTSSGRAIASDFVQNVANEGQQQTKPEAQRQQPNSERYRALKKYLKNGEWEKADNETYRLMITKVGKEEGDWFTKDELLNFDCEELLSIDALWVKYSQGKFGFSVQKELYVECGGILDGERHKEAWDKFCYKNGWRKHGRYVRTEFDINSPKAHLPIGCVEDRGGGLVWEVGAVVVVNDGSLLSHPDL